LLTGGRPRPPSSCSAHCLATTSFHMMRATRFALCVLAASAASPSLRGNQPASSEDGYCCWWTEPAHSHECGQCASQSGPHGCGGSGCQPKDCDGSPGGGGADAFWCPGSGSSSALRVTPQNLSEPDVTADPECLACLKEWCPEVVIGEWYCAEGFDDPECLASKEKECDVCFGICFL
jgi:hypothetical protein